MPAGASASGAVKSSSTQPASIMSTTSTCTALCSSVRPARATPMSGGEARPRFRLKYTVKPSSTAAAAMHSSKSTAPQRLPVL